MKNDDFMSSLQLFLFFVNENHLCICMIIKNPLSFVYRGFETFFYNCAFFKRSSCNVISASSSIGNVFCFLNGL